MGVMEIIDYTGDTKLMWDKTKQVEVDVAKDTFKKLKKKGYVAYRVDRNGEKGEIIHNFDINLERIIMAPRIVGG